MTLEAAVRAALDSDARKMAKDLLVRDGDNLRVPSRWVNAVEGLLQELGRLTLALPPLTPACATPGT